MKEIGSEFWKIEIDNHNNDLNYYNIGKDIKFLMSGRTAIDYVLNEIIDDKKIVYMPEYCCESMVQPFIDNGYEITYYGTNLVNRKYNINFDKDISIFFAMSYFGYNDSNMDYYIKKMRKKNVIVIEDITHRLLCKKNHCKYSNYLIASLRKWFPICCGGIAINMNGKFKSDTGSYEVYNELIDYKRKAMELKKKYISDEINEKDEYLKLFNKCEEMFSNYKLKSIDNASIYVLSKLDYYLIREKRIDNLKIIESKLRGNRKIRLLYKYKKGDCPLFVPILINNRDSIRKKLIEKNIYCPVHWPKFNSCKNEVYDKELSLICDQRYTTMDIEQYIDELIEIVGE